MNIKVVKVLGVVTSLVGAAATVASNILSEKQQDAKIVEEVAKALANQKGEA